MGRDVVVVDDHSGFREQARELLERIGYRVVGEAATGSAALAEVGRLKPDAVLLDVQLPDVDGISVAARLTSAPSAPAVVLVSARDQLEYGTRLNSCGAVGFIAKSDLTAESLLALLQT